MADNIIQDYKRGRKVGFNSSLYNETKTVKIF